MEGLLGITPCCSPGRTGDTVGAKGGQGLRTASLARGGDHPAALSETWDAAALKKKARACQAAKSGAA
jgi:hypothetical protein